MSSDIEFKEQLLNSGIFRHASNSRYTCQCPFCNDDKRHMYVLIDMTSDIPVLFNCFKCQTKGRMNRSFLEFFGLENLRIPRSSGKKRIETSTVSTTLDGLVSDTHDISSICRYINSRVGRIPTLEELQYFRYVGDPVKYVTDYLNTENIKALRNRHWFQMTNGNIIGRYETDDTKYRWLKYKTNNLSNQRGLFVMKTPIDLYQTINVCISEGVMDSIGLYYHYDHGNNVYISCMGKDYNTGVDHIISMGIFGKSVNIKVFVDSDVKVRSNIIDPVTKRMFGKVEYYHNVIGKDYGLKEDQIEIEKIFDYK